MQETITAPLGRALILAALLVATLGAVASFIAGKTRSKEVFAWGKGGAYAFAGLMVAANALMVYALLARDFSVGYVAQVGSKSIPNWVALVSLWSSLEGSILFWGLILGVFIGAATWTNRDRHPEYMPWAVGLMLTCGVFFAFLIAGPANPFLSVTPRPDGPGPNPLLQNHYLMIIHPPTLYLGYVGMVVPFAFTGAALIAGRLGADFLRPLRFWLMVPWTFLTAGIILGGWWAYEVLGWGGYWAWDPVENASFHPWLTATAAVHSLLVTERRQILKGWTCTLILASFLLTILGTFLTRSGVVNSVHSFTQSDIGPTFLVFLALVLIFSVGLLAARIGKLEPEGKITSLATRESALLANNLIFVLLTFTVLLGTLFPLIVEATQGRQISVGEPYFNRMSVPLGVLLLFLMGVGPGLPWNRSRASEVRRALLPPLVSALVVAGIGFALGGQSVWLLLALMAGGYTLHVTLVELVRPMKPRLKSGGLGDAIAWQLGGGRRRFGAYVAHIGVVLVLVAIAVSSSTRKYTEVSLNQGDSFRLGDYVLTFTGARGEREKYREATVASVELRKGDNLITVLEPRMNQYFTQREPIGTPAVHSSWRQDIYLSLMSVGGTPPVLGLRAFINPMVVWIWIGTAVIALGSLLSLWPRRRRVREPARSSVKLPPGSEPQGTA